jgi:hypothetical protein
VQTNTGTKTEHTLFETFFLPLHVYGPCSPISDIADIYSITSVAAASNLAPTVKPSARAVLRLMTRSNLVGN